MHFHDGSQNLEAKDKATIFHYGQSSYQQKMKKNSLPHQQFSCDLGKSNSSYNILQSNQENQSELVSTINIQSVPQQKLTQFESQSRVNAKLTTNNHLYPQHSSTANILKSAQSEKSQIFDGSQTNRSKPGRQSDICDKQVSGFFDRKSSGATDRLYQQINTNSNTLLGHNHNNYSLLNSNNNNATSTNIILNCFEQLRVKEIQMSNINNSNSTHNTPLIDSNRKDSSQKKNTSYSKNINSTPSTITSSNNKEQSHTKFQKPNNLVITLMNKDSKLDNEYERENSEVSVMTEIPCEQEASRFLNIEKLNSNSSFHNMSNLITGGLGGFITEEDLEKEKYERGHQSFFNFNKSASKKLPVKIFLCEDSVNRGKYCSSKPDIISGGVDHSQRGASQDLYSQNKSYLNFNTLDTSMGINTTNFRKYNGRTKCCCDQSMQDNLDSCKQSIQWLKRRFQNEEELSNLRERYNSIELDWILSMKHTPSYQKQILMDLSRTFADYPFFDNDDNPLPKIDSDIKNNSFIGLMDTPENSLNSLGTLLLQFSVYEKDIGYIQGLNYIGGSLLYHCEQYAAFWLMILLCDKLDLRNLLKPGFPDLKKHIKTFEVIMMIYAGALYKHLIQIEFDLQNVITEWMLILLTNCIPLDLSSELFDGIFKEGWGFIYKLMILYLKKLEKGILQMYQPSEVLILIQTLTNQNQILKKLNGQGEPNIWSEIFKDIKSQDTFVLDPLFLNSIQTHINDSYRLDYSKANFF